MAWLLSSITATQKPTGNTMQLLVRIKDKVGSDPYHDARLTKRGDVIVAVPDDHQWGLAELSNPEWRIISCPGMTNEEAQALLQEEPGDERTNKMLQRRAFKLDLDNFPIVKAKEAMTYDENAKPTDIAKKIEVSDKTVLEAVKILKPALTDPAKIGPSDDSQKVIGPS